MKKYEFILKDLDCANCANKIQEKLSKVDGLENVIVNFGKLELKYETDIFTKDEIEKMIQELEPEVTLVTKNLKKYEFTLKDLDCANCANKIQEKLSKVEGMENVIVNFGKLNLKYETNKYSKDEVEKMIQELEPEVTLVSVNKEDSNVESKTKIQIIRLIIGIVFLVLGLFLNNIIGEFSIILSYIVLLCRTVKNALKALKQSHEINENFLVAVSCIGAYLVGEHFEGAMVIILYEIGKILEEKAINKTRKSISDLMDIKPEYANLKINDEIKIVLPDEVNVGDIIVVKQGEKIPLDGTVIKGSASLDTASLTGESKLLLVKSEMDVLSGSVNTDGLLEVKVSKKYENSTVSKILELVENATDKKAKTETIVNKFAKIYTPIVILLAVIVGVLLPLFTNISYSESIYRALTFLVISCPCAIAISIPLSYFSGIGRASKSGILIKGSDFLDSLKNVNQIVFDKTGTLTKGEFGIEKIEKLADISENEILKYAVLGESFSNHPIAKSIIKSAKISASECLVKDYREISGKGIEYKINGKLVLVGNRELVGAQEDSNGYTKIYVKVDDKLVGVLDLSDSVKLGTKDALSSLRKIGIKTKMFTGDCLDVAKKVAKELEIDEVKAEMLPNDKYTELEKAIKSNKNGKVAFVGDGINDSPVLALADVGISMGGVGAQSAIEASDIVIMTDDISKIKEGIDISRFSGRIIKQNLIFAIITKILILSFSVFGLASMWSAIFADVGVTLITILNTLRILRK